MGGGSEDTAPSAPGRVEKTMSTAYNDFSHNQLVAHRMTFRALGECLARLASAPPGAGGGAPRSWAVSDLGCAGGQNSIELVRHVFRTLDSLAEHPPIVWHFEDLPSNDWNVVSAAIRDSGLLDRKDFFHTMTGRSFYDQVLPPESVDLSLSYICLHWMSEGVPGKTARAPCAGRHDPKKLKVSPAGGHWASPHERGAPEDVLEAWRQVANSDLVRFLRMRAVEMKEGAEGLYMFVGGDGIHEVMVPPVGPGGAALPSVFTQAFERAILAADGSRASTDGTGDMGSDTRDDPRIGDEIFDTLYVPYFLRTLSDVRESLSQVSDLFETVEVHSEQLECGKAGDVAGVANMMWTIHENCLATTGGVPVAQLRRQVKPHFEQVISEIFPGGIVSVSYAYVVVRRLPGAAAPPAC